MASSASTTSNPPPPPPPSAEITASNDDLLTEVLLRLPIKSLIKFKSVSKRWLSLISNPHFSLRRSPSPASALFLRRSRIRSPQTIRRQFDTIDLNPASSSAPPFRSLTFDRPYNVEILQSCNGLLLCSTSNAREARKDYHVYNPTTKHYSTLPRLPSPDATHGLALAFDPSESPHYKVICVTSSDADRGLFDIMLYSSDAGPWRASRASFAADFDTRFDRGGVFCNGSVHWLDPWGSTWPYFSVAEERLGRTPKPPVPDHLEAWDWSFAYFGESRGHLHLVDHVRAEAGDSHFDVLELERDYSRWFVKYRVDVSEVSRAFPEMIPRLVSRQLADMKDYYLSVICVVRCEVEEDSYLVMNVPGKIVRFNLKSGSFCKVCDVEPFQHLIDDEIHDMVLEPFDAYQYIASLACV